MKYNVEFALEGEYKKIFCKNGRSADEVKAKAEEEFSCADFGGAKNLRVTDISIEEDGEAASVILRFSGTYSVCVNASGTMEAEDLADEVYMEEDFGEADDIDAEIVNVYTDKCA